LKKSFIPDEEGKKRLFLVLSSAEAIRQNNIDIVRSLIAKGHHILVITTNQPYEVQRKIYERNEIDLSKIFFIDAITNYAVGTVPQGVTDVKFISSPSNLTDLGIAISGVLSEKSGERTFIVFDSVNTMLIYLPSVNISKFLHFIANRLRFLDIPAIFLAVEKGLNPMMLSQISTLVDEIVDLEMEGP
jgi:hypothetical protein